FINNIGYEVFVTHPEQFSKGKELMLYIFEQTKEDGTTLFGFADKTEKELFELLIKKVNGIGAKTALVMLRYMSVKEIITSVREGNFKNFLAIPGIGEKTAKRIIVELGGGIDNFDKEILSNNKQIAKNALLSMEYDEDMVDKVIKDVSSDMRVEEIIRECIRKLSNE
ncbi:MAG: Holliday junction branch migration protein RuvA, partial [Caldisericaceae bacterium]